MSMAFRQQHVDPQHQTDGDNHHSNSPVDDSVLIDFKRSYHTTRFRSVIKQLPLLCWVFTIAENLEFLFLIKNPFCKPIKISKQELIDNCKPNARVGRPYAFNTIKALRWIQSNRVCLEDDYSNPFKGIKLTPGFRKPGARTVSIGPVHVLLGTEEEKILKVLPYQPLVARMIPLGTAYDRVESDIKTPYYLEASEWKNEPCSFNGMRHAINIWGHKTTTKGNNVYHVRDPSQYAPGAGEYTMKRASSIGMDESNPIEYAGFTEFIKLHDSSEGNLISASGRAV